MKHWWKYIKPYKAWFILGPLCMIVEVIGEVLMPMLLARVINAGNTGDLTVGFSIGTAGLMILIALAMMGGGVGGCYYAAKASIAFAGDIRTDLYQKIKIPAGTDSAALTKEACEEIIKNSNPTARSHRRFKKS